MSQPIPFVRFVVLLLTTLAIAQPTEAAPPRKKLSELQQATAAIVHRDYVRGSAFCINKAGYYVCLDTAVRHIRLNGSVSISANGAKPFSATLVRRDSKQNLALLRTKEGEHVSLNINPGAKIRETLKIRTLAFQSGKLSGAAITVLLGRVASVLMDKNTVRRFGIDQVALRSGSAVVSQKGELLGLARSATEIIPINQIAAFLLPPEVRFFAPESIEFAKRHQKTTVSAMVKHLIPTKGSFSLSLTLSESKRISRTIKLQMDAMGNYFAEFPAMVDAGTATRYPVEIQFSNGSLRGEVEDRKIKLNGKPVAIGKLARIGKVGPEWSVNFKDGSTSQAKNLELGTLPIHTGSASFDVAGNAITAMTVYDSSNEAEALNYVLTTRLGKAVVDTRSSSIRLLRKEAAEAVAAVNPPLILKPIGDLATFGPEMKTVELGERISRFDIGGSGRYFIIHLPKARKVRILDVVSGDFVAEIPNLPADAGVAAGANKLVVLSPGQRLAQRYSLPACKREIVAALPDVGGIQNLLFGANVDEPILVGGKKAVLLLNGKLEKIPVEGLIGGGGRYGYSARGSADGRVYGGIPLGYGPVSYTVAELNGNKMEKHQFSSTSHAVRWAQPSANGRLLFTPGGIYDRESRASVSGAHLKNCRFSPTVDSRYFVATRLTKEQVDILLCTVGDRQPFHTVTGIDELKSEMRSRMPGVMPGGTERIHWIPWAGVIASVPQGEDKIHLRRIDLTGELREAESGYLFVDSLAPATAVRGLTFRYQLNAQSSDQVNFRLAISPPGMTISKSGGIRWDIPRGHKDETVSIIVALKNGKDREVFHRFDLRLR